MARPTRLPTFLVVGAAKSGTTALYDYLRQHPQVFMSPVKETNFFALDGSRPAFGGPRAEILNTDAIWRYEDYVRLFARARLEPAIGEVCPRYLFTPGTAARIKRRLPEVKIIAVLRHPADRAFSSYAMYRRDGFEPAATLAEALADEPRRLKENWAYAIHGHYGFYGAQLEEYYAHFAHDQIRCYLYDDFLADPDALLRDIFGFIGVDQSFRPDMRQRANRSGVIRNPALRFLWTRTHAVRGALPLLPKGVRSRAARFVAGRAMDPLPFPPETRERLLEHYDADMRALARLITRDLAHWHDRPTPWPADPSSRPDDRDGPVRAQDAATCCDAAMTAGPRARSSRSKTCRRSAGRASRTVSPSSTSDLAREGHDETRQLPASCSAGWSRCRAARPG